MVHDLQVWNNDVRFYCVKDSLGIPIAYFYFDPYARPSEKRGGAWMDVVFGRGRTFSRRLPIAHIVCNQTPPMGDKPSLMTFREVRTDTLHLRSSNLTSGFQGINSNLNDNELD